MFPRSTFGLGILGARETKKKPNTDEDWYIPYNGPYEAPREQPRKQKARDSWGDLVDDDGTGDEDEDLTRELHKRYGGGHNDFSYGRQALASHGVFDDGRIKKETREKEQGRGRTRSRTPDRSKTLSVVSGRTTSSGAVDPNRASMGTAHRRSTVAATNPPPMPSYISLATGSGGVGESPVPHARPQNDMHRVSLASLFTFGGRRTTGSPARSVDGRERLDSKDSNPSSTSKWSKKGSEKGYGRVDSPGHRNSNSSSSENHRYLRQAHQTPVVLATSHQASANKLEQMKHKSENGASPYATDDEDYYLSYYSTLLDRDRTDHVTEEQHPYQTVAHPATSHSHPPQQDHSPHSTGSSSLPPVPRRDHYNPNYNGAPVRMAMSRQSSTSSSSPHPYALQQQHQNHEAFDERIPQPPRSAPLVPTPHTPIYVHPYNQPTATNPTPPPKLTFSVLPASADAAHNTFSPRGVGTVGLGYGLGGGGKSLRNSTSTPNLRQSAQINAAATSSQPPTAFAFPKGKDRWLSAETWCDAMFFPRPRLKLKRDLALEQPGSPGAGSLPSPHGSGRIVSPPGTPLGADFGPLGAAAHETQMRQREPGIASRVLAHSRSLVDLKEKAKEKEYPSVVPPGVGLMQDPQSSKMGAAAAAAVAAASVPQGQPKVKTERPPRPKSFAQDDLALPTPVPSLAHVLEQGQLLKSERQAWQTQAANSFGNKRARSVSRTRAKSLTQKGRKATHHHQSSMEYLAAQACLGSQNVLLTPTMAPPHLRIFGPPSGADNSGTNTMTTSSAGRTSHSHSNSLAKTISKSTNKTHSRNDSWNKAGPVRVAAKLCGYPMDDDEYVQIQRQPVDLETALKGEGTRVIRLADPAHIPLDKGPPMHQNVHNLTQAQDQRKTPSPAISGLSDSKVGIALGTPPEEDEPGSYTISHPYAQGGYSFAPNTPTGSDFAGPHPSVINPSTKVPPISDILARHKLPPHLALHPHPYASNVDVRRAHRDSYLDSNGLIGQFRSDDGIPHQSKMWAQLSPGVVREVLPGDLQYSPYQSDNEGESNRRHAATLSIHDTAGVADALVYAARFRESIDSGLVVSEDHASAYQQLRKQHTDEVNATPPPPFGRKPSYRKNPERPVKLEEWQKPSDPSTNHTFASSTLDSSLPIPSSERRNSSSPAFTTDSSSPRHSPRPLGSPNDLDQFQDLFYKPPPSTRQTPIEVSLPDTPSPPNAAATPWDVTMRNRRTGSGLTSLARQLSAEFQAIAHDRSSFFTHSRGPSLAQSLCELSQRPTTLTRQPTESSLQFVFEDMPHSSSPRQSMISDNPILDFGPSGNLPEDVQSSRASSLIENLGEDDDEDEDHTALFRVGMVESVSTPPAVASERRFSFNGETVVDHSRHRDDGDHPLRHHFSAEDLQRALEQEEEDDYHPIVAVTSSPDSHDRILSGLQPPLTEATRSSYMTTSTLSRMSNLSDFPVPPKGRPEEFRLSMPSKHMSLLSSYFNEEFRSTDDLPPPPALPTGETNTTMPSPARPDSGIQRSDVMFGDNQDARDVAKILSSPQAPTPF